MYMHLSNVVRAIADIGFCCCTNAAFFGSFFLRVCVCVYVCVTYVNFHAKRVHCTARYISTVEMLSVTNAQQTVSVSQTKFAYKLIIVICFAYVESGIVKYAHCHCYQNVAILSAFVRLCVCSMFINCYFSG